MDKLRRFASRLVFGLLGLWFKFIEGADLVADNKRLRSELRRSIEINKDLVNDWYSVKKKNEDLEALAESFRKRWVE